MTRFRAAGIHLALSALIVIIVLALMLYVWYPNGLFKLLGGSQLLYLIAGVDLTLGPLLTLIVFKAGKKSLKFDLAVIGIIQLAALIYGASVMFKSRPVFIVLEQDVFKVTLASEFKDDVELLKAKKPEWQKRSIVGPQIVGAVGPTSQDEKQALVMAALSGLDWNHFPKLFVDYDSQRPLALKNAKPLSGLRSIYKENNAVIDEFLKHSNRAENNYVYLPIVHDYNAMIAVLTAKDAQLIEIIEAKD